jgi:hypothetical protein
MCNERYILKVIMTVNVITQTIRIQSQQLLYSCESVATLTEKRSGIYYYVFSFIHIGNVEACFIEKFQLNFARFLFKPERLPLINYVLLQLKFNFTSKLKSTSVKVPTYITFSGNELFVTACSYSHVIQDAFNSETKLHGFIVLSTTH